MDEHFAAISFNKENGMPTIGTMIINNEIVIFHYYAVENIPENILNYVGHPISNNDFKLLKDDKIDFYTAAKQSSKYYLIIIDILDENEDEDTGYELYEMKSNGETKDQVWPKPGVYYNQVITKQIN